MVLEGNVVHGLNFKLKSSTDNSVKSELQQVVVQKVNLRALLTPQWGSELNKKWFFNMFISM